MSQAAVKMKDLKGFNYTVRPARLEPNEVILVIEPKTQKMIGKVVNFNESGMQLMMHSEMELNLISDLTLVLNKFKSERQYIEVFAELLWIKKDNHHEGDGLRGGFYFNSKNFKSKFRLNQLIKSLH